MEKNKLCFVFVVFFLLLFIFSDSAVAESFEVADGGNLTSEMGAFTVTYYRSGDAWRASIRNLQVTYLVDLEECKFEGVYEVCFESVEIEHDATRDVDIAKGEISIEAIKPEVIREIEKSGLFVGESTKITVTVRGPDDARVPVKYEDGWPSEVIVESRSEDKLEIIGNRVIYETTLRGEESFSYKIKLIKAGDIENKARLYYGEKNSIETAPIKITTKSILGINLDVSESKPKLNEVVNLSIELENDGDAESISVDELILTIPDGVEIVEADAQLTRDKKTFKWDGELSGDLEFNFRVKPVLYGEFEIMINARVSASGKSEEAFAKQILNLVPEDLYLFVNIPKSIVNIDEVTLAARIKNTNKDITFQNINCNLEGVYDKEFPVIPVLLPDREVNLENEKVSLKEGSAGTVKEKFSCTYETLNGQKFYAESERDAEIKSIEDSGTDGIVVEPINDSLEIDNETAESVVEGDAKSSVAEEEDTNAEDKGGILGFFKRVWRSIVNSIFNRE